MTLGVRSRLIGWLVLVLIPATATGILAVRQVESQTEEQISIDIANSRRLEAARIEQVLSDYLVETQNLATSPDLVELFTDIPPLPISSIPPMQEHADDLLRTSGLRGTRVINIKLVDRSLRVLGETMGFEWLPSDPALVESVLQSGEPAFGNAFLNSADVDLLGMVIPVFSSDGAVSGALIVESDLGPVVDLLSQHEDFGQTTEAHLAQLTPEGDAQFITGLRFDRDAAFSRIVPASMNLPINRSFEARDGLVIWDVDYRQTESILAVETLESTGWGLVVKVDKAEAVAPIGKLKSSLSIVGSACLLAIFAGWLILIKPISRRLRETASAAARLAGGDYESLIDDNYRDEIGAVATSIDQLAQDLASDIKVRAEYESQLRRQATHDDLTGLCNRQHATELLRNLRAEAGDRTGPVASVLFLDLDGFKQINDIYGHGVGDEVLKSVAGRLSSVTKDETTVSRWGGDEFVVVLPNADDAAAKTASERVERVFGDPVVSSVAEHHLGCSIGRATLYVGGSIDSLLTTADDNMFTEKQKRTKRGGVWPGTVRVVKKALETDRVAVWYQPQMRWRNGSFEISGCEALARVRTEDGLFLPPAKFVEQVQNSELGLAIDRRVIEIATAQSALWFSAGLVAEDFTAAINIGGSGMRDVEMADFILGQARLKGLGFANLMIEISDQAPVVVQSAIRSLVEHGVTIAVDDVGTNHSNVDRLIEVGATVAKLDRRWFERAGTTPAAQQHQIAYKHLVKLCQELDVDVFAKGVETQEQFDGAHELGVRSYQGHFFGQAMPPSDFEEFLASPRWAGNVQTPK